MAAKFILRPAMLMFLAALAGRVGLTRQRRRGLVAVAGMVQ